jgi:hypothetical protein
MPAHDVVHIVGDEVTRREAKAMLDALSSLPAGAHIAPFLRAVLDAVASGGTTTIVTTGPDVTRSQAAAVLGLPVDAVSRLVEVGVRVTSLPTLLDVAERMRAGVDPILSAIVAGKDVAAAVADLVRAEGGDVEAPFPGTAGDLRERLDRWG